MQIKDIFFIKTILDRETAGSHNGETGYYSVSDNMFSEGHSCYCDNGFDWYNDLKGIFYSDAALSGGGGFDQTTFINGGYHMTIVKLAGLNNLTILLGGINVSLNYDGNYYYTQNNYCSYGGTWYRFDYVNGGVTYVKTYGGGSSYAIVDENVETTLYSSMPIMMYYSNADRNVNYARIDGDQGIGSGGWQVPNPNPTRKIMLNGVLYSQVGGDPVETESIILNGNRYSGGNKTNCEIVSKDTIINANGNFSYDVAELEAGYYLATFTSNLEKNSGLTEDHGNLFSLFFHFDGTNQTANYSFDFTVNGGSYGAFQIVFAKSVYNILLTTWGGWQLNEIKMNLAKVDQLVVEKYV